MGQAGPPTNPQNQFPPPFPTSQMPGPQQMQMPPFPATNQMAGPQMQMPAATATSLQYTFLFFLQCRTRKVLGCQRNFTKDINCQAR